MRRACRRTVRYVEIGPKPAVHGGGKHELAVERELDRSEHSVGDEPLLDGEVAAGHGGVDVDLVRTGRRAVGDEQLLVDLVGGSGEEEPAAERDARSDAGADDPRREVLEEVSPSDRAVADPVLRAGRAVRQEVEVGLAARNRFTADDEAGGDRRRSRRRAIGDVERRAGAGRVGREDKVAADLSDCRFPA